MRDFVLLGLVIYTFSLAIIAQAQSNSQELHNASIAMSTKTIRNCRARIVRAFLPPYFQPPQPVAERDIVPLMNAGTIHLHHGHPAEFRARRARRTRAGAADQCRRHRHGAGRPRLGLYAADHHHRNRGLPVACRRHAAVAPVNLVVRIAFNPNVTTAWFTSVMGIINNVTMLAIILAGAAIVREREHGTMDHLLVMPVTPFEIAMSKVWANGLVITVAVGAVALCRGARHARHADRRLDPAVHGRRGDLFVLCHAPSASSSAPWRARCRSSACCIMLVFLPMNMLSGSNTPLESMPPWLATVMQASPSTHFVVVRAGDPLSRRRLRRGMAAILLVAAIGGLFFFAAVLRFRSSTAQAG